MAKEFLNEENDINLLLEARKKKVKHYIGGKEVDSMTAYNAEQEEEAKDTLDKLKKYKQSQQNNKRLKLTESLSDYDLLNLLEEQGFETSYTNLCLLKEGINNGTIILEEDSAEEIPKEEIPEEQQVNEVSNQPRRSATVTPDGTVQMNAENSEIVAAPDGTMTANLYEAADEIESVEEEIPEEQPNDKLPEEEVPTEDSEAVPAEDNAPRISISMPVDGSMQIDNCGKQIVADAEGNVNVALAESKRFLYGKNTERFLKSYLMEDCGFTLSEYMNLTEEVKNETIKDIALSLLKTIEEKIFSIDTTPADRSRGDIKQLRELSDIQTSVTQLESLVDRSENVPSYYKESLNTIVKSILYINQYTSVFKEAYRNKKTIMIMKYQSLILSVISSVSYVMASIVDFKSGEVQLKDISKNITYFAPLQSLSNFVKSVESGEFKTLIGDVNILREHYLELSVKDMQSILEATDYVNMIVGGVQNIFNQLTSGPISAKISDILYKAIGIIVMLFSLRDTFYTIFKMKTNVSDMTNSLHQFSNVNNNGSIMNKLSQFASKFKTDAEYSSDMSKREIEDENKKVYSQVKEIQLTKNDNFEPETLVSNPTISTNQTTTDFGFDF